MGTGEGSSIPCPRVLSQVPGFHSTSGSEQNIPGLCYPETQISPVLWRRNTEPSPGCLTLATTTHKMEGCPQALPEKGWALPILHPELPTSFFCSMAWCMILASFFFSSSRTDGESDWSSVLGNFLPKTQARRTVDAEPQGQAEAGRNPWRQAPVGRESTHLSERTGVLRGREGCAGAREWVRSVPGRFGVLGDRRALQHSL